MEFKVEMKQDSEHVDCECDSCDCGDEENNTEKEEGRNNRTRNLIEEIKQANLEKQRADSRLEVAQRGVFNANRHLENLEALIGGSRET